MANRAYVSIWSKNFSEATMLEQFGRLLEAVPFSAARPGFNELVIRPVDSAETPVVERDLRSHPLDAASVINLAREYLHADSAYEVQAHWDLWVYDSTSGHWRQRTERLEITCHGEEYDAGVCAQTGHFQADVGFEHLFTGHAGLLGAHASRAAAPQHPAEAEFLAVMTRPENLREYHQRTRENIQKLMDWLRSVEQALPVEHSRLWSEGEENFEARLDEILAVR
jgi:hypothetical protein